MVILEDLQAKLNVADALSISKGQLVQSFNAMGALQDKINKVSCECIVLKFF